MDQMLRVFTKRRQMLKVEVNACVRERERECVCVCERERATERERERGREGEFVCLSFYLER